MTTMLYIFHLLPLSFLTLILLAHATLNLYPSDHKAFSTVRNELGFIPRSDSHDPCNFAGVSCQWGIMSNGSRALRITSIVFEKMRLSGVLSPSVGGLSELKQLSLANNRLSGRIPLQLVKCQRLEILNLHNNRFSGEILSEFPSLVFLRVLDLSSNKFSGNLNFLKSFPNLDTLSVADNMFTGKVPASLRSFQYFNSANFSGNHFLELPLDREEMIERSVGTGSVFVGVEPHILDHLATPANRIEPADDNQFFPKRHIYTEDTLRYSTTLHDESTLGEAPAPSPSPSVSPVRRHKKKKRAKKWTLLFLGGALLGFIGGMIAALLYKVVIVVFKGEGKGLVFSIFSQWIKAEDLAFLEKEDGLASLQVIGRGGCGEVYKVEIGTTGKVVAIKKVVQQQMDAVALTEEDTKALNRKMRQIKAEIQIVGQIRHRNLIPLLAHVARPKCHYLVYEFMKNGSLEDMLRRDYEGTSEEDWLARHRIALGIATGLEYLHINHSPHIIHRDLKPANILLDDNMEAHISDFGLSKVVPVTHTHMTTSNVAGTLGYIAPEYHQTMKFTTKCDIYSFGVVLAVLVTGKFPSDGFFRAYQIGLVKWLRTVMVSEDPKIAIDPRLLGNGYEEQMLLALKISCYCTRDDPKERPNSKDIRCMLERIQHHNTNNNGASSSNTSV